MTSDWKDRANKRRDERHTKVSDEYKKPKPSKKDTKKWCKGKIGQEHKLICTTRKYYFSIMYEHCCSVCGKVFDTYYPRKPGTIFYRPQPDWVTKDE